MYDKLFNLFGIKEDPSSWPLWFHPISLVIGALAEEAIKVLPFLWLILKMDKGYAYTLGALLGFGFGIGEAWYLAFC
ncbi:MAG: YhfC family intramembrane metalloprotease, partial [bacterium]